MRSGVVCAIAVALNKATGAIAARPINPPRIALNPFMFLFPLGFIVSDHRYFAPDLWSSNSNRSDTHSIPIKPNPTTL